ncbi:MAG: T9SS type B sorting domain-containing protein, partial [Bacteroidota bacterium]|nr:T9SS type B sorting domain-containing protein [Bacteroidota bacterium]
CNGDSDAYARINAENGIGEFDYLWSDNQTSDVATGLLADWYTVTVTDNIGCTKTDSIEIKEPEILYSPVDSANSNLNICFGYSTGAISINPLGGNSAYSYSWSTSETTDSIGGLVRGYYDVTVTDYKGCETDTSVLISESDNPSIKINKTDISCNNLTDGSATAITALTPIAYQWSTGETTQTINGLSAGNYEVTITHLGGCEASDEVTIIDPPLLTASTNSNDITCAGTGNGYVNLTVDGGTLDYWDDYNYSWSPGGETSQNISDLSGGTYYVTVEDEMGCTAIDSAEINEPPPFLSNITPNNVRCYGENNGSIQLNVEGGNGESETFDYLWSNGSTDINQTELEPGYYFVTVSDTVNCTIKDSVEITEPELLSFNMNSSDISCYGYNDGYAAIDIFGGNGGNNIIWQPNNETSDSIYNLAPDEYFVTITDSKGCDTSNSVIIEEPKQINTNTEQTNISCFNSDDGIISLNPEGGISPYRYNWDFNPELSESEANNLPAGNYVVTVTDNNNCEEISEINLTQPNKLTTEIYKTDISCFGFMDGNINLDVSGGTPDYQYQWSNNQSEVSISLLDKGDYNVKITDQHNCKIDTTVTIEEPDALTINAVLTPSLCPDVKNGSIELNISGGTGEYNTYWGIGLYDEDIYEIHSGNYELVITDENLCRLDSLIYLPNIHDICIEIPNAFTPNNDFINDKWEINMFNLYPNVIIEVFDRYGKKVFYSKGYEESQYWDGTYNGKELPMDSYYYIIYLQNGMERLKGVVSIIK